MFLTRLIKCSTVVPGVQDVGVQVIEIKSKLINAQSRC